jgi:hypothetical protein
MSTTKEEITERINDLDGVNKFLVDISMADGTLTIIGSNYERVKIFYFTNSSHSKSGWLIDESAADDNREMFIRWDNGEDELIPLSETISRNTAINIAVYFVEHNALPPHLTRKNDYIVVSDED